MDILTKKPLWCLYGILFGLSFVRWRTDAVWAPDAKQYIIDQDMFIFGPGFEGDIGVWPSNIFAKFPFIEVTHWCYILWEHYVENLSQSIYSYNAYTHINRYTETYIYIHIYIHMVTNKHRPGDITTKSWIVTRIRRRQTDRQAERSDREIDIDIDIYIYTYICIHIYTSAEMFDVHLIGA